MKLGAIILARMDSSRLPGKALKKIGSKTLLEHCISKLAVQSSIRPILATSDRDIDRPLLELATNAGIQYFAGDLSNVAQRVLNCADQFELDYFARINGDSPFIDTSLLTFSFDEAVNKSYDFVTNLVPRSFPYGVSIEIFSTKVFREGYHAFQGDRRYEEHITSYFYDHIDRYKFKNIECSFHLPGDAMRNFRLVVDTPDDYDIISAMYSLSSNIFNESLEDIYHTYKQVNNNKNIKHHL